MDEQQGFLPPEPPGPEPDLETPPPPPAPPPAWQQPQPPAWQQQPPPAWQQQQPAWQPVAPPVPGNPQAIAGFVLSVVAAALLVVSFGLSSIVSIVLAVLGMVFSSKGRRNVDEGRTPKHRDLARAGFITGIVSLVLSVLATAAWVAVAIVSA
jgi:hypothetical protein